jgi:hypothetical protein
MNSLDSLNIRKGLELEVPVADIFLRNTSASGEILAKEICELGWQAYSIINPSLSKRVIDSGGTIYDSEKKKIKISESLIVYVYNSYVVDIEYNEEIDKDEAVTYVTTEMEFVNTEILDFNHFCVNVMQAQSFTGKYDAPIFKFSFYGYGNFSMDEYVDSHRIISVSNIHTLNFFVKHNNVVSGISCFLNGLHRNDIIRQREYLTSKEFATLLNDAEMQFELVSSIISKSSENPE